MTLGRRACFLRAGGAAVALTASCGGGLKREGARARASLLEERIVDVAPGAALAVTDDVTGRCAIYDSALLVLTSVRRGRFDLAGRLARGLARVQLSDGALPFSVVRGEAPSSLAYVRSGAVAWAGYAACELLDVGGAPDAGARGAALAVAHRAAAYLRTRQVAAAGDVRDGLVTAGHGMMRYRLVSGVVREVLEPGDVAFVATEHNLDAYFFLRRFARVTAQPSYAAVAERIATALRERLYLGELGQLASGADATGVDRSPSLDCASWGAAFFAAVGDRQRAETSLAVAEGRYASRDAATGGVGHKPYARGAVWGDPAVRAHYRAELGFERWDEIEGVWPEGTGGVAFAALVTGETGRAKSLLAGLEPLRQDEALPTFTREVPFVFDRAPSLAGTAWAELVRFDLARHPAPPTLWSA